MRLFHWLIAAVILVVPLSGMAQDELVDLRFNETLRQRTLERTTDSDYITRDIERGKFIYIIDTLALPFFDDFTKDRVKRYHAKKTDNNITQRYQYDFTVNGSGLPRLEMMFDTTYLYTKLITGQVISEPNPLLHLVYYDTNGKPIGSDTGWTNVETTLDQGLGIVTQDTLQPDLTLINSTDTFYAVADDRSLWITPADEPLRGGAFINNAFAVNPLTQGVATFDGTDALGVPYDLSSETSYGPADTLESKPFLLTPEMENVYLSFFFQAGGLGNEPEFEDSLVLEFFNVTDSTWNRAWGRKGAQDQTNAWTRVWVEVADEGYKEAGFKFRFRNYASLFGSLDHWHIDYVELDQNRNPAVGDTLSDVGFASAMTSFTAPYSSVPYDHYLANHSALQASSTRTALSNLGFSAVNLLGIGYRISDDQGALVTQVTGGSDPNIPARSSKTYSFDQPSSQIFPDLGTNIATFNVETYFNITGGNDEHINDTVNSSQVFWHYYAYDDGTAEKAYTLTGSGTYLSYAFTLPASDTLKALLINFPRALNENAEDLEIEIMVWEDTATSPIYVSSTPVNPKYTYANQFARFELETPIIVNGTFFIGFRQLQADKMYMGFDVNNIVPDKLFIKTGPHWKPASFDGSLLMRADFGNLLDPTGVDNVAETDPLSLSIYPNPAQTEIAIGGANESVLVNVFSLNGSMVLSQELQLHDKMNVSHLPAGFYMVQMIGLNSKATSSAKLIIAR